MMILQVQNGDNIITLDHWMQHNDAHGMPSWRILQLHPQKHPLASSHPLLFHTSQFNHSSSNHDFQTICQSTPSFNCLKELPESLYRTAFLYHQRQQSQEQNIYAVNPLDFASWGYMLIEA